MATHPLRRDPEEVRAAWSESTSLRSFARALGASPSAPGLKRLCAENGLEFPASHWGNMRPPKDDEVEAQIQRDSDLQKAQSEASYYRQMYGEALRQLRGQDEMVRELTERFATPRPAPRLQKTYRQSKKLPERTAVLLLSDWQLGQLVTAIDTGGVNEFDWQIAEKRAARLVDACVGHVENVLHAYRVDRLIFALLGDIVEGHDVYSGQPWQLEKDAAMQTIDGSELFASIITGIMEPLRAAGLEFDLYGVPGNHGKPGGKKGGALPATFSFDYLLYEFLRRELANWPFANFGIEPAGRLLFMAAEHVCLMTHGDEVRGWGGFPFYGLDKAHARLVMDLETVFHYWLLGHWHAQATLPAGRGARIVNGNAVGPNQLTTAAVLGAAAPQQTLAYFSRDYGLAELAYLVLAPHEQRQPVIWGQE